MKIKFEEWINDLFEKGETEFNLVEYEAWEIPDELLERYLRLFGIRL